MDDITMDIRTRLDQLFSQYQPSRALTELKEELVGDLTEAVTDKVNQGQDASSAIDEAMAQLGDIDTLLQEVAEDDGTAHQTKKTTGKHAATSDDPDHAEETDHDDDTDDEDEQDADDGTIHIDNTGDDSRVRIGKLQIHGDKVTWGDHVLVDGENDKVDFGKLVQVDGDHVTVADGLVDVQGDDVKINGERPRRTYVESLRLVNTQSFAIDDLNELDINYRDAAIKLGPANADQIVVNEYMSRDNSRYYLRAGRHGNLLAIKQGDRPRLWPLHARAEIFLPAALAGKVTVHAGNGSLEISDLRADLAVDAHATNGSVRAFDDHLTQLKMRSTNGSIRLDQVTATHTDLTSKNGSVTVKESTGAVRVESSNGSVRFLDHTGNVDVRSQNGAVKFDGFTGQAHAATANGAIRGKNINGGGTFHTGNGSVNLQLLALTSDVTVESGAGSAAVQMPLLTDYQFDLKNWNASVKVPQEAQLSLNDSHHKIGTVGDNAERQVNVEASTGSIRLS